MAKKRLGDGIEILDREFFSTPEARAQLREAETSLAVSIQIYELRTRAGLTQKDLAALVGISHSVISRLESDDYEGYSLPMLQRVAAALDRKVEVRFVPSSRRRRS